MAEAIKYKDHTVAEKINGIEEAAYINDSFKGILRLSPNTNFNNNGARLEFLDSITNVLKTQYISVSSSDGILLDMRINSEGVEYNKLNVLGNLYSEEIFIYSNRNGVFNLGNRTEMPLSINKKIAPTNANSCTYEQLNAENIDYCYFLASTSDKKRKFEFKSANEIIGLIVQNKLLEVDSVPTGSVHFIPISPSNYSAFLMKNSGPNIANLQNNTLIRDYLICDGKEYDSVAFPELAKILYKTKVVYWDNDGNRHEYINGDTNGKFRVPDLRCQFLRSVNKLDISNSTKKEVGTWEMDSTIEMDTLLKNDDHYHYIVLDSFDLDKSYIPVTNNMAVTNNNPGNKIYSFKLDKTGNIIKADSRFTPTPRPLARLGNITSKNMTGLIYRRWGHDGCEDWGYVNFYTPTPLTKGGKRWAPWGGKVDYDYHPHCGYIISRVSDYNFTTRKIEKNSWIGLSSQNIDAYPDATLCNLNYTEHRTSDFTTKIFRNAPALHGYENTPEYYAMLPIIKI